MNIEKILERIKVDNSKKYEPTLETLQLLQKQYILNVPYENLDFFLHRPFSVELENVYEKIITNNRGGICYESHTLFIYLLKNLGFTAHFIFAKVEDLTYIGKDYPHLILLVNIDGIEYLVDVANGQNVREPMNINDENFISTSENNRYKINQTKDTYTLLVSHKNIEWLTRYYFTTEQKNVSDFKDMFEPDKSQNNKHKTKVPLIVTLAKEKGRVTMQNNTMSLKEDNDRRTWNITEQSRADVLKEYFNIIISEI